MQRCENLLLSAYLKLTQAASRRFKKFNFCIKNKSIASTLCAQLFSTITLNHH